MLVRSRVMVTCFFPLQKSTSGVQRDILVVVGIADAVDGGSHMVTGVC